MDTLLEPPALARETNRPCSSLRLHFELILAFWFMVLPPLYVVFFPTGRGLGGETRSDLIILVGQPFYTFVIFTVLYFKNFFADPYNVGLFIHLLPWQQDDSQPTPLQQTNAIVDRLWKACREIFCQLAAYAVISFQFFFEFPSGIPHPCTTMPWTIWSSLMVLWGVCWMFRPQGDVTDNTGISDQVLWRDFEVNAEVARDHLDQYRLDLSDIMNWPTEPPFNPEDVGTADIPAQSESLASGHFLPASMSYPGVFPGEEGPTIHTLIASSPVSPESLSPLADIMGHNFLPWPPQHAQPGAFSPQAALHSPSGSALPQSTAGQHELDQSPPVSTSQMSSSESPSEWYCSTCGGSFCRKDTLDRHMSESLKCQGEGGRSPKDILCPKSRCRKSTTGNGFKRPYNLAKHLERASCKPLKRNARRRRHLPVPGGAAAGVLEPSSQRIGGTGVGASDTTSESSAGREGSTPQGPFKPSGGGPSLDERAMFMEKCLQADREELRAEDQEILAMEEKIHAMGEELRARKEAHRLISERVAVSQGNLSMLLKQQGRVLGSDL